MSVQASPDKYIARAMICVSSLTDTHQTTTLFATRVIVCIMEYVSCVLSHSVLFICVHTYPELTASQLSAKSTKMNTSRSRFAYKNQSTIRSFPYRTSQSPITNSYLQEAPDYRSITIYLSSAHYQHRTKRRTTTEYHTNPSPTDSRPYTPSLKDTALFRGPKQDSLPQLADQPSQSDNHSKDTSCAIVLMRWLLWTPRCGHL